MTNTAFEVQVATPKLSTTVAQIIGAAFRDLEASVWLAPDESWRDARYWRFFQHAYVDPALTPDRGRVYVTVDRMAAAVWLHHVPGAIEPPTPEFVTELADITGPFFEHFTVFDELLAKAHARFTRIPHDVLGVIGAHPVIWRRGSATALMRAHLAELDRRQRPAYLEAANATLVEVWKRFGFAQTGDVIRLPNGHCMFPMWREPE